MAALACNMTGDTTNGADAKANRKAKDSRAATAARIKKGGSAGGSNSVNNVESISGVRGRTAASFMIVNSDGKAVREVFNTPKNRELLGKINPKYKVVTAGDYLASLNTK